ncbi:MAG: hypothetical protein AB7O38_28160 [Pirellulaceae bacterium]
MFCRRITSISSLCLLSVYAFTVVPGVGLHWAVGCGHGHVDPDLCLATAADSRCLPARPCGGCIVHRASSDHHDSHRHEVPALRDPQAPERPASWIAASPPQLRSGAPAGEIGSHCAICQFFAQAGGAAGAVHVTRTVPLTGHVAAVSIALSVTARRDLPPVRGPPGLELG